MYIIIYYNKKKKYIKRVIRKTIGVNLLFEDFII